MRRFGRVVLVAVFVAGLSSPLVGQPPDAAQVLAAAREALGGEAKLAAVKTFVITGRTRQLRGNNLVPIEFEIDCELPDKFVRVDDFPAQDTDPTTLGFNGAAVIQVPPAPRAGGGPPRLLGVKQDFARLTMGMFATSFAGYPLTFKYAALAEAPEGKADVLDVSGPANFAARYVVQRETHLPVMLMWQVPAQPKPIEHRMYYADFRNVDGLKLPFRIRRAVGPDTVEETTVDRIKINAKIDPRKFEASK